MPRRLGDQSITILRAGTTTDSHNDGVPDWDTPSSTIISNCYVEQGTTDEQLINRDTVEILWTVYAPPGIDVLATDRIVFEGITYDIDGQPGVNRSFTRKLDYTGIALKRWEG
jgi:hypothetical protein